MLSVVIGLAAAIVIGGLAIILALRVPCGTRRKRKEITQGTTTGEGSPGPSDKSIGSKELDGNESDEKNPDIIPDTMDSDDQVIINVNGMIFNSQKRFSSYFPPTIRIYSLHICIYYGFTHIYYIIISI